MRVSSGWSYAGRGAGVPCPASAPSGSATRSGVGAAFRLVSPLPRLARALFLVFPLFGSAPLPPWGGADFHIRSSAKIGGRLMKGAKCSLVSRLHSLFLANLFGRSCGLSRSTLRRTSTELPTSASSSGASSAASGMRSASLVTPFVVVFTCFSLLFPAVASANPLTIGLTAWNAFITAINFVDAGISSQAAVTSAEDLQVVASNLRIWTGTASQAQTIAQELERVSGYDIDSGNHINTVYGLTGNGNYDQEQICPDCAGGYVATDHGLEVCDTCGGDGMYYWDTVPYTSTHECMIYLASWIEYLSATQTDWSTSSSALPDGVPEGDYYVVPFDCNYNALPDGYPYSKAYVSVDMITAHQAYVARQNFQNGAMNLYFVLNRCTTGSVAGNSLYDFGLYWSRSVTVSGLSSAVFKTFLLISGFNRVAWNDSVVFYQSAEVGTGYYEPSNSSYRTTNNPVYMVRQFDPSDYEVVHLSSGSESFVDADDSGVTWGTDIDWYTDTSDAGAAGGTTVTNEGDTIYNSETNTYVTNNNIDVEPITQRLDVLNAINAQIGVDLRTLNDSMFKELNDLEWWLQRIYYAVASINNTLESIRSDMANLDRSTNDLVDLSSLESGVSSLSGDIDALLAAVTGSHGADALGLYGRLDTVLNWLDDYSPVDLTVLNHQLGDVVESDGQTLTVHGLLHWINYYAQDIDRALSEWPEQVATDLTVLNHQLGDVVESDGQTLTVHGLLHWINYYAQDIDRAVQDILALGTVTVDGTTYGFADLAYNTWLDLLRLVGMSSVTADGHTYSFADLLYNMWLDLGQHCNDFVEYWSEVVARLDGVIDAIEDLPHSGTNPWRSTPVSDPDNPTSIVPVGPTTLTPYGYPELPDWETYREPLNIPALEHAIDELMQKFPFSMLNTIVQVAAFIERPAVAPQFDVPAPNPSDWSQPYMVHIDLSEYDTVAATLRLGIVIWAIVRISNRTIKMWVGDKAVE